MAETVHSRLFAWETPSTLLSALLLWGGRPLRGLCWLTEAPGLHRQHVQQHEASSDLIQAVMTDRVLVIDRPPSFRLCSAFWGFTSSLALISSSSSSRVWLSSSLLFSLEESWAPCDSSSATYMEASTGKAGSEIQECLDTLSPTVILSHLASLQTQPGLQEDSSSHPGAVRKKFSPSGLPRSHTETHCSETRPRDSLCFLL